MRSIKELLIIVRDNLEPMIKNNKTIGGICRVISALYDNETITVHERNVLIDYMDSNVPRNAKIRRKKYPLEKDVLFVLARHWWTPRNIVPRIKWLNIQIKKRS